ncbi:MAG TPA: hypothetical protein VJQ54_12810 [Candidatus Sulfotelmatobacter sp.]|nr:hypothetical protein [Candidatus Sulfotelmatobacter sp.]
MIGIILRFFMVLILFSHIASASAEGSYRLTAVAAIYSAGSSKTSNLELPVNPAFSSVLTLKDNSFYLNYDGASVNECGVEIKKIMPFAFDSAPLGSSQKLNSFLERKFHINSSDWKKIYLLQDAPSSNCAALSFSRIYASDTQLVLLDESFLYVFDLEKQPFRDASKGFDCTVAKTAVDRLICGDPKLKKMDASVNYGFVLMQLTYSKEISYEDPVRVGQINWVSSVRNKCSTTACLSKVYSERINYFKSKVSEKYPSYPNEEDD